MFRSPPADLTLKFRRRAKGYGLQDSLGMDDAIAPPCADGFNTIRVNGFDDYTVAAPNAWAAMAEAAEKETKEDAGRLNEQLLGIEHEVVIGEGNLWEVLSNLISEKGIDLVVVGTRGRTGFGKTLLGSVAEQLLRQSRCRVLTVGRHVNP